MVLSLVLSNGLVFGQQKKNSKAAATPKPSATIQPTATAKPTASTSAQPTPSPKASSTPETAIDAKTEAELLRAEDRLLKAIRDRDAKVLEEVLHPGFADAIEGAETAVNKRGFIMRARDGRLPAYKVEKERVLERSGDSFTVEGTARDGADLPHDHRGAEWAHVRRIWTREGGQWIVTAQIVEPMKERAEEEQRAAEKKEK